LAGGPCWTHRTDRFTVARVLDVQADVVVLRTIGRVAPARAVDVVVAGSPDDRIATSPADQDVVARSTAQGVGSVLTEEEVVTPAAIEEISVCVRLEEIVPGASVELVRAGPGVQQRVVADAAAHHVDAGIGLATGHHVVTGSSDDEIVAHDTEETVVAAPAVQLVVAHEPQEGVVTVIPAQQIVPVHPDDHVVTAKADDHVVPIGPVDLVITLRTDDRWLSPEAQGWRLLLLRPRSEGPECRHGERAYQEERREQRGSRRVAICGGGFHGEARYRSLARPVSGREPSDPGDSRGRHPETSSSR